MVFVWEGLDRLKVVKKLESLCLIEGRGGSIFRYAPNDYYLENKA